MEYFIFNGLDSREINGLIIKEMPPIVLAERKIESVEIDGRNGNLHIDSNTYASVDMSIICVLTDLSQIDTIKSYLNGTHKLQLSTIPNREYNATIKNQIDFTKYLNYCKEFPIQLEIDPISKSITETTVTATDDTTFTYNGNYGVQPKIEVKGSGNGTITLNDTQINLKDLSSDATIIDCELAIVTKNNANASSKVTIDDFPSLINGTNTLILGENITEVKIKYNEGWL